MRTYLGFRVQGCRDYEDHRRCEDLQGLGLRILGFLLLQAQGLLVRFQVVGLRAKF